MGKAENLTNHAKPGEITGKITAAKRRNIQRHAYDLAVKAAEDGDADAFAKLAVIIERMYQADRKARKPLTPAASTISTVEDRKKQVAVKLAAMRAGK